MKKGLAVLLGVLAFAAAVHAATYTVDPVHSSVAFQIKHMVVNNVRGEFTDFGGTVTYDPTNPAATTAEGSIKAASISTRNDMRDKHLRSADFFDVEKYPEITFKTKRVEPQGDHVLVVGDLMMHGVTREIQLPVTVAGPVKDLQGKERIGLETSLTIDRQDFGLSYSQTLDNGGLILANDVKIELNIEAVAGP